MLTGIPQLWVTTPELGGSRPKKRPFMGIPELWVTTPPTFSRSDERSKLFIGIPQLWGHDPRTEWVTTPKAAEASNEDVFLKK